MRSITGYLLDTGIVIELMKQTALGRFVDRKFGLGAGLSRNVISVVTVGEALVAAEMLKWGSERKEELWTLLNQIEWIDINDRMIFEAYALIDVHERRSGRHMKKNDLWIAATAHVTEMPLLTTDSDYDYLDPVFLARHYFDPRDDYSPE